MRKIQYLFLGLTVLSLTSLGLVRDSHADTSVTALRLDAGPTPAMKCDFKIKLTSDSDLNGMSLNCTGEDLAAFGVDKPAEYTLPQARKGVVLMRQQTFGINVITLRAIDLDPRSGGTLELRYVKNAVTSTYGTFRALIQRVGSKWVLYTEAGRQQFDRVKVTTHTFGVKSIVVN